MSLLKHALDNSASALYVSAGTILDMDLKGRLARVKQRVIDLGKTPLRGAITRMAEAAGCSVQNMSQALLGINKLEDRPLRNLAKWAQVEAEWLIGGVPPMLKPEATKQPPENSISGKYQPLASSQRWSHRDTTMRWAPVIRADQMGKSLLEANTNWPESEQRPFVTTAQTSGICKFVMVNDDNMAPRLVRGDWALFDPERPPERGKRGLFLLPDGDYVIRFYEPLAGGGFEARDESGRCLDSIKHGIVYVGLYLLMQSEGG
jgi:hypothetical protein